VRDRRCVSHDTATLPEKMDKDQSPSVEEMAVSWISYHLWSATRPRRDPATAQDRREEDAEADRHGFWACEAVNALVLEQPEKAWSMILRLVELSPDDRVLADVAAGPLEDLLGVQSYAFIDRVENQTRINAKFRRCVSDVWGWSSIPDDAQIRMRRIWEGEEPL
jgi:hypothetical protein